jgi:hypothetical protein
MQYVFENYPQAQEVGARAAKEIRSLFNPQAIGQKIRHRLEYITRSIEEKNWYESQAQAWRQAAKQAQTDLDILQHQVSHKLF